MKRSKHSLSHYKLLTCDMGELVPCALTEVLPGDTVQQATSALLRVSPLLAPVMHPVHVRIHHWFVPHRIVWEDWEDFITGGPDGFDTSAFPTITFPVGVSQGGLGDYLGIPPGVNNIEVNALPFRAYALIWNEFYRDQDLQTKLAISEASGPDAVTNTALQRVGWEKDYFTSARPWTQKGPEVVIPLTGDAPVLGLGVTGAQVASPLNNQKESDGQTRTYAAHFTSTVLGVEAENDFPKIRADLSQVDAANINDLRLAFALQRYEEARARYGSRYTEYLRYLGVRSSDARLQRPEYLGGGKQTIQFSEVLKTGAQVAPEDEPIGTMKGHGIAAVRSNRYRRFFEEHGFVISMLSVRPRTMYVQGLARHWSRRTKEDFWQKELQHIGQQEVFNREVYASHTTPGGVFGYQDRYDEYRRAESGVAGDFRTTLDYWHMARLFASDPTLNASFVEAVPTKRVNAVQTEDTLWVMMNHSIQARRAVASSGRSFIF